MRAQIEGCTDLQPAAQPPRNSPISGVFLTNADLDHILGLFLLREGSNLGVYATKEVQTAAMAGLGLGNILNAFCGVSWEQPPAQYSPLSANSSVQFRAIPLPGKPPLFAKELPSTGIHSVAYQFLDPATDRRLLVAPDVAILNSGLLQALAESDAVLFDGTFWSQDELGEVKPGARTADEMGHVTIRDCSLEILRDLKARHKIYVHINNTNPILSPGSPERAAVEAAGIVVGYDGLEFDL